MPLIAHRGYQQCYPENSLLGFEQAINAGAKLIELDVQLSADLKPVLYHDRTMERVSGVGGAIHDYDFKELTRTGAGETGRYGERFSELTICPLLDFVDFLQRRPGTHAYMEIKRVAIEQFGVEVVLNNTLPTIQPVIDQLTLISFSTAFITAVQSLGGWRCGLVLETWESRNDNPFNGFDLDVVFCNIKKIQGEWCWSQQVPLALYDITDPALAKDCLARGASIIETFDIGKMRGAMSD